MVRRARGCDLGASQAESYAVFSSGIEGWSGRWPQVMSCARARPPGGSLRRTRRGCRTLAKFGVRASACCRRLFSRGCRRPELPLAFRNNTLGKCVGRPPVLHRVALWAMPVWVRSNCFTTPLGGASGGDRWGRLVRLLPPTCCTTIAAAFAQKSLGVVVRRR